MAKKRSGRKGSRKIPIAMTLGFATAVLGGGGGAVPVLDYIRSGNINDALNQLSKNITGYDPGNGTWSFNNMNLAPLLIGSLVSIGLGRFVNRRLNLPYVKL